MKIRWKKFFFGNLKEKDDIRLLVRLSWTAEFQRKYSFGFYGLQLFIFQKKIERDMKHDCTSEKNFVRENENGMPKQGNSPVFDFCN